jgi:methyl-accepting chemotaxis protein
MAASNMVTTESKFSNLRKTLESIFNSQDARMSLSVKKAEASLNGLTHGQVISTIIVAIIAIGISFLNLWMFKSFIKKTKDDVAIIANGDFTHKVTVASGDELGELAMSVDYMRQNIHDLLSGLKTTTVRLNNSSTTLNDSAGLLTKNASIVDNSTNVISSAGRDVSELAERMTREARTVSSGSASTAHSLNEMKYTIQEISKSCLLEVQMGQESSQTIHSVLDGMNNLGKASKEIGGILEMIDDIAGKTRLLALNATIEAASAGAAGRGFAVVASEVKALAVQSNSAASQIKEKIGAMQLQVENAVKSIQEIAQTIEQFSGISQTISAAVEEQTATVSQIAHAVDDVSQSSSALVNGMEDVSQRSLQVLNAIKDVGEVVTSTARQAYLTADNSGTLKTIAQEMDNAISRFHV